MSAKHVIVCFSIYPWNHLVTFECLDAFTAHSVSRRQPRPYHPTVRGRVVEFPHLDRFIKTATDERLSVRRKGNRVDAILMPFCSVKSLEKIASVCVPNSDTLVERPRGNKFAGGRDGHSRYAVFDRQA